LTIFSNIEIEKKLNSNSQEGREIYAKHRERERERERERNRISICQLTFEMTLSLPPGQVGLSWSAVIIVTWKERERGASGKEKCDSYCPPKELATLRVI